MSPRLLALLDDVQLKGAVVDLALMKICQAAITAGSYSSASLSCVGIVGA